MEFLPGHCFRQYAASVLDTRPEEDGPPIVGICAKCKEPVVAGDDVIERGILSHLHPCVIECGNCGEITEQLFTVVDSGDPSACYAAGDTMEVCADCYAKLTRRRA